MSTRDLTIVAYCTVVAFAIVIQLAGLRRPEQMPTIGRVLTWAMRRRSTQLAIAAAWWWLGWHMLTGR